MLNRIAESLFWIGRYTERAENHARLFDAFFHIREEARSSEDVWSRIVQAVGDPAGYERMYGGYGERQVFGYMVLDLSHANSLISCISGARNNLRMARERIPESLWDVLNSFYLWLKEKDVDTILNESPYLFFKRVHEWLATFQGISYSVMLRDPLWHLMEAGRHLERSENTVRLLHTVYRTLPENRLLTYPYLLAVVRAVGGLDAFRRNYSDRMTIEHLVGLLILNDLFPRSIQFGLIQFESHLQALRVLDGKADASYDRVLRLAGKVRSDLAWLEAADLKDGELESHLQQWIASHSQLGEAVAKTFFHNGQGVGA